jgi:hypothetical protein
MPKCLSMLQGYIYRFALNKLRSKSYVDVSAMFSLRSDIEFATIPTYHTCCFATMSLDIGLNTQVSAKVEKKSVQYRAPDCYVYRLASSIRI